MAEANESLFDELGEILKVREEWRRGLKWRSDEDALWLARTDDPNDPLTQRIEEIKGTEFLGEKRSESMILFDGVILLAAYHALCQLEGRQTEMKTIDKITKAFTPAGFTQIDFFMFAMMTMKEWGSGQGKQSDS